MVVGHLAGAATPIAGVPLAVRAVLALREAGFDEVALFVPGQPRWAAEPLAARGVPVRWIDSLGEAGTPGVRRSLRGRAHDSDGPPGGRRHAARGRATEREERRRIDQHVAGQEQGQAVSRHRGGRRDLTEGVDPPDRHSAGGQWLGGPAGLPGHEQRHVAESRLA